MKHSTFGLRLLAGLFSILAALTFQSCLFGNDNKGGSSVPSRGYYAVSLVTFGSSPYPASRLHIDSAYSIRWNRADSITAPSVRIQLYKGDTLVLTLSNGYVTAADTGNYAWSLAVNRPSTGSGSNYRIKITSTSDTSEWDYSPNFAIYSNYIGSISITAPTASTVAQVGTALPITWISSGSIGLGVGISLYRGDTLLSYLGGSGQTSGTYTWVVSSALISSSNYRIRVYSSNDPAISAFSSNFRITTQYFGSMTITTPAAAATLASGTTSTIAWTTTGSPGTSVTLQLFRDSSFISTITTGLALTSTPYTTWVLPSGLPTSGRYRIRISSVQDPGIFSFSEYFTITGITPDLFEPDNQRPGAKVILDSATQSRTLSYLDTDWVQINTSPGRRYLAGVQSTFLVYVYVADSNGIVLSTNTGTNLQVPILPTYAGRYYVMVRYYSTTSAYQGSYSLFLRGYDSTQSSFPVPFSAPGAGAVWAAGSAYDINWVADTLWYNPSVTLRLYQDSTLVMTLAAGTANDGIYNWLVPAGLPTGSNYRLQISNSSSAQIYAYSPTFTISGIAPDAYEPDNVRPSAKTILDSATQTRSLTYSDTDWVQFTSVAGKRYVFNLQAGFTSYAEVLDSNGVLLYNYSGATQQVFFTPLYAGRHYFRVRYYSTGSGYQGAYSLTMRSYDTSVGFPVTFTAPAAGATLAAGSSYSISWVPDSVFYGTQVSFALYRDTVAVQTLVTGTANDGIQTWTPSAGLTTAGDYRIRIVNYNNPQIFSFSPSFTISGISADAYEPDNVRLAAKSIPDSTTQSRTLTLSDSDWVQITVASGRRYLATLQAGFLVYTEVLDSNGALVNNYSGSALQIFINPTYAGRYYLRIRYYSTVAGYQGAYSLNLRSYDAAVGFPVTFTAPAAGATLVSGSTYSLGWVPDSGFYGSFVNFALYRDTVLISSIVSGTANDGVQAWTLPAGLTTAGDYRVRISNNSNTQIFAYSPAFTISGIVADAYEPDNVRLSAKVILDSATQARTLTLLDTDWVQINSAPGRRYLASIQSTFWVAAYVLDSNGAQLSTQTGANLQLFITPTYTGRYYLRIQYYSTATGYQGPYNLTVRSYDPLVGFPVTFTSPAAGATLVAGSAYSIGWVPDSSFYGAAVTFGLYRDTVFVQTLLSSTPNDGIQAWTPSAGLTTASDYRIRIVNPSNAQIFSFSPTFTISGITADAYEPDNSRLNAKSILDSSSQSRTLTLSDSDWVQVTTLAGRRYLASVQSAFLVNVYLLDSNGNTITTYSGSSLQISIPTTYSGRYYVRVQYYSTVTGYQGPYTLSLYSYSASQPGFPVTFTAPAAGATLNAGTLTSVTWVRDTVIYGPSVAFQLYRDTVMVVSITTLATNSGTYSWSIPAGLATAGNYRLRIVNYNNAQVFGFSPGFTISGLPQDAMEPNDSSGSASVLNPGPGRSSLSLTYLDRDWFRFTGTVGRIYTIRTISTITTTIGLNNGLGGSLITSSTKAANDSVNHITWYCPVDGPYSFQVTATTTGNYSLEFQEYTNLVMTVTAPASGDTATRGLVVPIRWSSVADIRGSVDVFLYNASGVVRNILVNSLNTGTYNWVIPADSLALPAGIDYYIRVVSRVHSSIAGNSGTFRITNQPCVTNCGSATTWDFESSNGGFTTSGTYQWAYGTPTYSGGPMAAHSGSRVWGTSLATAYSNNAVYNLVSPTFVVPSAATLTFWHWIYRESIDYPYVEISTNGGATYTTIASTFPTSTGAWVQATYSLAAYAGQTAILRWRFTTDVSVTYGGWLIDDVEVR